MDALIGLVRRLLRPTGRIRFVDTGGGWAGFRLPAGSRWQWFALQPNTQMRLRWGSTVTPVLETLAAPGASQVHVHPGDEVYVEFLSPGGAIGTDQVWVAVSPNYEG